MIHYGLFSFPYLVRKLGNIAWLAPFVIGVAAMLLLWPMIKLCKKFPNDTLFVINVKLLTKPIGKLVNLILIIYAVLVVSNVSYEYLRLVQIVSLPESTITMTSIFFFLVLISIVYGGIKLIARFCIFSFFMTGWMACFLLWPMSKGIWIDAISNFNYGVEHWLSGIHESTPAFIGFELILFFFPYIMNQKKAYIDAITGLWMALFFFISVTLACVIYFSVWQLENTIYPVLSVYKAVELSFLDRIENFGLSLWVFLTLSTCAAYLWVAKRGLDSLISKNKNKNWHLYFLAFLSLFLYLGPIPIVIQEFIFRSVMVYMAYGVFIWPFFLLIIAFVRKPRRKQSAEQI